MANDWVVAHGPEEIETFMREFLVAAWADYRLLGEEFRDVGTKVFCRWTRDGARKAKRSRELSTPMHSRLDVSRRQSHWGSVQLRSAREALEAAGLRE